VCPIHTALYSISTFPDSPAKLEQACAKALSYSGKPSYKSIKNLLAAMKDNQEHISDDPEAVKTAGKPHGITRGADYYRR